MKSSGQFIHGQNKGYKIPNNKKMETSPYLTTIFALFRRKNRMYSQLINKN